MNALSLKTCLSPSEKFHDGLDVSKLLCPKCGYDYNHIKRVFIVPGKDEYNAWEGRGDAIRIEMSGECGHYWEMIVGVHKGQSFSYARYLRESK